MDDSATNGARLRILRRYRGMTQAQLGGLAGLGQSYVSMIETGERCLDRRSHIAALATALRVSETDLVGGPHLSPDRLQAEPHAGIPALRDALQLNTITAPAGNAARPLTELAAEMRDVIEPMHRDSSDYAGIGSLLPALIDELHVHVAESRDEATNRLALETLTDACVRAASMCWGLSYLDLAHLAATRALEAAAILGDPVQQGKADWAWLLSLPRSGMQDRKLVAAERAASRLQPHADDRQGLQVLGMLTLGAAMSAAALQRHDTADHWIGEAESIAARLPDEPARSWQQFSATNVSIWTVAVRVERGEAGGAVLDRARRVDLRLLSPRSPRRASLLADAGRGLARDPKTRPEAVRWLRQAEEAAPQRVRNSAAVRETVAFLVQRARSQAEGRELRGMAARMGIQH